jgi:ABC-type transport system involved in Fe-S cluster assembly fused permease/ATPase subunit
LKNSSIIFLNEATALLDSHTEKKIQGALEMVTRGRTTIATTHRLSTITKCDQIIVLYKGKIVERGTHNEPLEIGGKYSEIWEKQTRTKHPSTETDIK